MSCAGWVILSAGPYESFRSGRSVTTECASAFEDDRRRMPDLLLTFLTPILTFSFRSCVIFFLPLKTSQPMRRGNQALGAAALQAAPARLDDPTVVPLPRRRLRSNPAEFRALALSALQ